MWTAVLLLLTIALHAYAQDHDILHIENWRVHEGDDLRWAAADFDDSGWRTASWPVRRTSAQPFYGGYRWYRATVSVAPELSGESLALGFSPLEEVYEVYVDALRVGAFGSLEPQPWGGFQRHMAFRVPAPRQPVLQIAIRRWTGRSPTNYSVLAASGSLVVDLHPPRLGRRSAVETSEQYHDEATALTNVLNPVCAGLVGVAGLLSLALFFAQRSRRELFWLGLTLTFFGVTPLAGLLIQFAGFSLRSLPSAIAVFAYILSGGTLMLFLSTICEPLRRPLRIVALVPLTLAVLRSLGFLLQIDVPGIESFWWGGPEIVAALAAAGVLVFKLRDRYSGLLAFTLCLWPVGQLWNTHLAFLVGLQAWRFPVVAGLRLDPRIFAMLLFAVFALLGLYLRYKQDEQHRRSLEIDLTAARKVQESLLPVLELAGSSAFAVDAVYLPAREVGGDFWQTVAHKDGSLLLVTGDVSGKGLPASMLVAAVVGALGTLQSRRPGEVLHHLNRALQGKTHGGFVTCCCALFEPSGTVTVANAGHPSPLYSGREVETAANLPLGALPMPDLEFTEIVVPHEATQMTFMSDGVTEAASVSGELFGFERARQISEQSAADIGGAARRWGQNDDITVVTVRRVAAA